MKKKTISLCLVLALSFLISVSAFATDTVLSTTATFEDQVSSLTSSVLEFIEPEKSLYGLAGIDFTSLYLGQKIPAHILTHDGIVAETDISYFPIMNDNIWVATSIVSFDSAGQMNVQVSTEYANAYVEEANLSTEIALLFDSDAAYIYTDNADLVQIAVSPDTITGRLSCRESDNFALPTSQLTSQHLLSVNVDALERSQAMRSFDNQYYLSVPNIQQDSGSLQCWAACIASIRGYYGTTTTIDDVYNFSGITKYLGANIYTAADVLEDYGFSLTWYWDGSFNWYQLRNEIYFNESPLFVSCSYNNYNNNNSGHAVVLRGYYVYQNISQVGIISYMDPVTGSYVASSVATDGDFHYVPSGSSSQYTMDGFLAVAN